MKYTKNILRSVGCQFSFYLDIGTPDKKLFFFQQKSTDTVKLQWLEHLRDYENLFETWVVRATESYIMVPGQQANGDNLGKSF